MYNIAFYIQNTNYEVIDFRHPELGNPGVGGTPYMIMLVATELARRYCDIHVFLYLSKEVECDKSLTPVVGFGLQEAALDADRRGIKFFVFDYKLACWWTEKSFAGLSKEMNLLPWTHTFPFIHDLNVIAKHPNVKKIINVGREEKDIFLDHPAFDKMDYIYNAVPVDDDYISKGKNNPYNEREHIVTFMGSLTPHKCFHIIAEIWPYILKKVPDAELYVIGTGDLYGNTCTLGRFGLSEQNYEDKFMKFLTDDKGKILSSVHFSGKLGNEKYDILSKTRVGVPNPTGKSETFCICAVEMQAMGCSVVAMSASGYYDTFYNGKIVRNKRQLVDTIIRLLVGEAPKRYNDTLNYINQNFSIEVVVKRWRDLLDDLSKKVGNERKCEESYTNKAFRFKWVKIINRKLMQWCPCLYYKPIEYYLQKMNRNPDYSLY